MSIVRLVWLLVTSLYCLTCALTVGLVLPTVGAHLRDDLAVQSQARAALFVRDALADKLTAAQVNARLMAQARAENWRSYALLPAPTRGNTLQKIDAVPTGDAWFSGPMAGAWDDATAKVSLKLDEDNLAELRLTASDAKAGAAMQRLWLIFVGVFGGMGLLFVVGLGYLVAWARMPRIDLQRQIDALSERRFIALKEPKVSEWVDLSRALNVMVSRVQVMLNERVDEVNFIHDQLAHDTLTHTTSRQVFMDQFRQELRDETQGGALVIARVHDLAGLNARNGRGRADELLVAFATALRARLLQMPDDDAFVLARLNGADFAILLRRMDSAALAVLADRLARALSALAEQGLTDHVNVAWMGASTFKQGEVISDVLTRVDAMVAESMLREQPFSMTEPSAKRFNIAVAQWRVIIENALDTGHLSLQFYPVVDRAGQLLHREAMLRLITPGGEAMVATDFIAPAIRCGRVHELDLRTVGVALAELARTPGYLAINLAQQSLTHPMFIRRLRELLAEQPALAARLRFEVRALDLLRQDWTFTHKLFKTVSEFGCEVGIDHFNGGMSAMPLVASGSITYLKLSPTLVARMKHEPQVTQFLMMLVTWTAKSRVSVIGGGVRDVAERDAVLDLGVYGYTGPLLIAQPAPTATPAAHSFH